MNIFISDKKIRNVLLQLFQVDPEIAYHSIDTARIAATIFSCITTPGVQETDIIYAAILHDIGKTCIPLNILKKPGELTPEERAIIETHPALGSEILLKSNDPSLKRYAVIIRQHHERPDGFGYPDRLLLHQINPIARIINIADRFAAMRVDRPYCYARPVSLALTEVTMDIPLFFPNHYMQIIKALKEFTPPLPIKIPMEMFSSQDYHEHHLISLSA